MNKISDASIHIGHLTLGRVHFKVHKCAKFYSFCNREYSANQTLNSDML